MKPWLLLDRDDTILNDPGYLSDPDQVEFLPGALEGLKRFHEAGWPLVVVTNQSGLGRGYFTVDDLWAVNARFSELLQQAGVKLAGLYYCPHAPDEQCRCRKPRPMLAQRASTELELRLEDAVVVGDKRSDLELGRTIGAARVIQIVSKGQPELEADLRCSDLVEVAEQLL